MNNIPMEVTSYSLLPECWLYRNKQYFHMVMHQEQEHKKLPYISASYESVLVDLGISFRKSISRYSEEILEYWDKDIYEEIDLSLPLYIGTQKSCKYIKNYTGKEVTMETVDAARKLTKLVDTAIQKYDEGIEIKEAFGDIKGRKAVVACMSFNGNEDIFFKDSHFKVLPVECKNSWNEKYHAYPGYCAIFDVNQIELNDIIEIYVPLGTKGIVVGKAGWQVKDWCRKLGLKRINVVEI